MTSVMLQRIDKGNIHMLKDVESRYYYMYIGSMYVCVYAYVVVLLGIELCRQINRDRRQ